MSWLRNPFNRPPLELVDDPYGYDLHQYKVRFSLIGAVRAGKSTLAAGLIIAAETMSSMLPGFYCRVLPKSSHIMRDKSNLRIGRFPPKTDPYTPVAPESGLIIGQKKMFSDNVMQIPICDVGGEVMDALSINRPTHEQIERIRHINANVVNHIKDSQGFILAIPATDALFFRNDYLANDADSYLYHIMNQVMNYKTRTKNKIEGIAVWLTKWDQAMEKARDLGFDIYRGEMGLQRFMDNGFPGLSMLIKPLRDQGKVEFFRSYFNVAKREDGVTNQKWDDGEPKVKILEDPNHPIKFQPDFAGEEYVRFIKWAASFGR
jgi:hypothetical protein